MENIRRIIQPQIEEKLFQDKAIIIYGARQVGKTTLIKNIEKEQGCKSLYLNCDEPDSRRLLTDVTSTELKSIIGDASLILIDEAQRVKNIGITIKLIVDNIPGKQVIATGSSSFDLSNAISEPLTGRAYEFHLYPFSLKELSSIYDRLEILRIIKHRMIYGMYPEIVLTEDVHKAKEKLKTLVRNYLYKDVLEYQHIKNSDVVEKLLTALALQIGQEVSYKELSGTVGVDKKTVANYIRLLEQAFIIFRLGPFSRNLRTEIKKHRKIYFYDTGIRNSIIKNLNPDYLRQDTGFLWENWVIAERIKRNQQIKSDPGIYFWRTHDRQELDYLEEENGKLNAYEFKWKQKSYRVPGAFRKAYPESKVQLVHQKNVLDFLL